MGVTVLGQQNPSAGVRSREHIAHLLKLAYEALGQRRGLLAGGTATEDELRRALDDLDHVGGAAQGASRHDQAVILQEHGPALGGCLAYGVGQILSRLASFLLLPLYQVSLFFQGEAFLIKGCQGGFLRLAQAAQIL